LKALIGAEPERWQGVARVTSSNSKARASLARGLLLGAFLTPIAAETGEWRYGLVTQRPQFSVRVQIPQRGFPLAVPRK